MEANRDRAPDFIPDHILDEVEPEARITVVSSRYLRDVGRPAFARRWHTRFVAARSPSLMPILSAIIGPVAILAWISVAPESTTAFLLASITTVVATVALGRSAFQAARNRPRPRPETEAETDR